MAAILIVGSLMLGFVASAAGAAVFLAMTVFGDVEPSREEFARVSSPDGGLEAVVVVLNFHATVAFCFEVHVVEAGDALDEAPATFTYRRRPDVRWADNRLLVDDAGAETTRLLRPAVAVGGRSVAIELASGGG